MEAKTSRPLWLVTGVILIGMLLIAGIIAYIGQHIYAVMIFPMLMGFAGGIFAGAMGFRFNITRSLPMIVSGALLGVSIYLLYRYFDYLLFTNQITTPVSLREYLDLTAKQGTSINGMTSSVKFSLGETMTWVYWLVELLVTAVIGGFAAVRFKTVIKKYGVTKLS